MKIPQSVRTLYSVLEPKYLQLKTVVDKMVSNLKEERWHYESRIKKIESFALKLETGRVLHPEKPEDFFGCTIVVENRSKIVVAEKLISGLFKVEERRPLNSKQTHLRPESFEFDDLRLYVKLLNDDKFPNEEYTNLIFEVQVKTFLQHAWGIAVHDFVYKAEQVDWASSRIAYQVKAMLENAELSIGEANKLTESEMICRSNKDTQDINQVILDAKKRWECHALPKDLKRFASNIMHLCKALGVSIETMWETLDSATNKGKGAKTENLSPFSAIFASLIDERGIGLLKNLLEKKHAHVFVPLEIELNDLEERVWGKIIRPPNNPM